ncbi:MAG: alanine racemase [Defluviitaleaceae bacterium]|nr:alanine racemase [Defluviitaleaceae bacterium]
MEYKRVYAEINLDNIASNMRLIRRLTPAGSKVMAVVKANGYGHGAAEAAKTALYNGADWLGVAICEEGAALREQHIYAPILVLGYSPEPLFDLIIRHNLTQTVFSADTARALSDAALAQGKRAKAHIKIDTGMSRLGFLPERDAVPEIAKVMEMPGIEVTGIYTHFAQSDPKGADFTYGQYARFTGFLALLAENGIRIPMAHAANSGAILNFPELAADMVRAGIILYGLRPSEEGAFEGLGFLPSLSLKTQISLIKRVPAGVSVGYGRTYYTARPTAVATVTVGYADGFSRHMSNGGRVLAGGRFAPVIGAVCMDQFMIDVTDVPGVRAGDEVVIIGGQGENYIPAEEVAAVSGTINYEIVCAIGKRVPRVYIKNGELLKTEQYGY